MRRIAVLLAWLLLPATALAAGAELEARLWSTDLSGLARVGAGGIATEIDLATDLGIAGEELPGGRLIWRPTRRTSLRLAFTRLEASGDATLDRDVTFGGTTFRLDARVASLLELEYGAIGFAWQPLSTRDGRLRLGPLIEAHGLRGEAALRTTLVDILPLAAREEFELGFAAGGLVLDVEPTRKVHVWVEWRVALGVDEGDLSDAEAGVRYYPLDPLGLAVGYRRLEIEASDGDERFDLELDGPFFGAVLRF